MTDPKTYDSFKSWLLAPRPTSVRVAMALVALQAIALGGYTLFGLYELIVGDFDHLMVAIALLVCTGLASVALFAAVRGMGYQDPWVRGLIITFQILGLLVGVSLIQGGIYHLALPLLGWVGAILGLMFTTTVNGYVGQRDLPFGDQD